MDSTESREDLGDVKESEDVKFDVESVGIDPPAEDGQPNGDGQPDVKKEPQAAVKDSEEKRFEENVKFLYRSHQREPGKRKVKPNYQLLEMHLNLPEEDSEDDSDYKVGDDGDGDEDNSDQASDPDNDDDDDDDEDDDDEATDDKEDEDGNENEEKPDCKDIKTEAGVPLKTSPKRNKKKSNHDSRDAIEKAKQCALEKSLDEISIKINVCNICLGDMSVESDEIVECDNCGVTVHEGCYGVSDSDSILSTGSSASTEPWFCDSCKAGIEKPRCELCPNSGGIFKETDAGRWVHLVCALYTPGCAFGSVEKLTPVTLFEMQYSKWGAKPCNICEDPMLARTGVTINCDAGMCRINFHVSCAQRMGLLSDANPEYIADPFYAHCKVHVDKARMKAKRKNWSILQHQAKMRRERDLQAELSGAEPNKERERVSRKLNWLRERYLHNKATKPKPWIPTQKMPRLLHSSSTAIEKFRTKSELYGLSHMLIAPPEDKRWHTQPAFSVEFVAYFLDRQRRMRDLEKNLGTLIDENASLRKQQALMNELYGRVSESCSVERAHNTHMTSLIFRLWAPLKAAGIEKEPKILANVSKLSSEKSPGIMKSCKVCSSQEEQHQQIECEQCHASFHLFCLNPPLTRFPKKSKGVNWCCEDCLEQNRVNQCESNKVPATMRRSRQPSSRMVRATSGEGLPKTARRKPTKRRSSAGKKQARKTKPTKEQSDPETEDEEQSKVTEPMVDDETVATAAPPKAAKTTPPPKRGKRKSPSKAATSKRRKTATPSKGEQPNPGSSETTNEDSATTVDVKKSEDVRTDSSDSMKAEPATADDVPETQSSQAPESKEVADDKSKIVHCTKCDSADTGHLVECDSCGQKVHWSCLNPPVKKNPKPRGYTWMCEDCDSKNCAKNDEDDETTKNQDESKDDNSNDDIDGSTGKNSDLDESVP